MNLDHMDALGFLEQAIELLDECYAYVNSDTSDEIEAFFNLVNDRVNDRVEGNES